jgi:hypothetical protein
MLAELAIANAAFGVIKQALSNGKELFDVADATSNYFKAENDIAKEVESKGKGSALEAYQAQLQLRKQEEELKFMLNKQGLLGYSNFLQFKAEWARDQKEQAKLARRKQHQRAKALQENLTLLAKVFGTLFIIMGALVGVAIYLRP